jgi:hypothetical protein
MQKSCQGYILDDDMRLTFLIIVQQEMAVYDNDAWNHPTAQSIFHDVIIPSLRSNERKPTPMQLNVMFNSETINGITKSGIYLGDYLKININADHAKRILFWVLSPDSF